MILKTALAVVLALVAFMLYKNSTFPSYLGVKNGAFAPMPSSPNAVSSQTDIEAKRVSPLPYTNLLESKKKVKQVLAQLPNNSIVYEEDNYMHIVFTTQTMKYNDDVELYFDENESLIHYRSQSRVGYSDGGLNRQRYIQFAELYQKF